MLTERDPAEDVGGQPLLSLVLLERLLRVGDEVALVAREQVIDRLAVVAGRIAIEYVPLRRDQYPEMGPLALLFRLHEHACRVDADIGRLAGDRVRCGRSRARSRPLGTRFRAHVKRLLAHRPGAVEGPRESPPLWTRKLSPMLSWVLPPEPTELVVRQVMDGAERDVDHVGGPAAKTGDDRARRYTVPREHLARDGDPRCAIAHNEDYLFPWKEQAVFSSSR